MGDATIEAFSRSGASLGVVSVNESGTHGVSSAFAGEVIGSFIVTADVDNHRIANVTYSACQ